MTDEKREFEEFMKRRESAANAYAGGDVAPLASMVTHNDPATFFSPKGDYNEGPEQVLAIYKRDATQFQSGESHFEILQMGASGDIGYWTGFQKAIVTLEKAPDPVVFNLRVTEIFRRESGEWKLIHRHADAPAVTQKAPEESRR